MFDRVSGLPAHPLIVHAAVVLVPLLVLGAILYAVLPKYRGHLRWPAGLLGVVAPAAIISAKLSGEDFKVNKNLRAPQMQALISVHEGYGDKAMYLTIALGVVTIAFVFLVAPRPSVTVSGPTSASVPSAGSGAALGGASGGTAVATRPMAVQIAFAVVAVALALVVGYYVFKVGDSGARMAWGGY